MKRWMPNYDKAEINIINIELRKSSLAFTMNFVTVDAKMMIFLVIRYFAGSNQS